MTTEEQRVLAQQLRKPHGELGLEVAHFMNKGNEVLNRNTIQNIQLKPNAHIVELGMGNGRFVSELFDIEQTITYFGVDYSEEMVNQSRAYNKDLTAAGKTFFYHNVATKMPFEDQTVDVMFTVNTIYFWDNPSAVLAECKRVLKLGGQLVIGLRPKAQMKNYPFVQFGFTMYSSEEVISLLTLHGFHQVEAKEIAEPDFVTKEMTMPVRSLVVSAY